MNPVLTSPDHRTQDDACERGAQRPEDDPEVRAHIWALQDLVHRKYGENGGVDVNVIVSRRNGASHESKARAVAGGSPGDWYEHEDQMSRPKGGVQERVWQ
ncbi:MAG: hypothetical protein PHO92_03215 [Candidatus Peribacteraceae bacterium]|nr:hypothetical protein [Candidatus Peribacteraceae bacterium]